MKDPSIVRSGGQWHLFCTVRGATRSHAVEYLHFADWKDADRARLHILPMHAGHFGAPQVFFYTPQRKWYLLCQASDDGWDPKYGPAVSTSDDISDPGAWTQLTRLDVPKADGEKIGLDFWIICDDDSAYLFFTSLDGRLWRSRTSRADFPRRWSEPALALKADLFEAGHIYRRKHAGDYLALVEAQNGHGWRYYKAYTAERLDGTWQPLAASRDEAFASMKNVRQPEGRWTDNISHGELLRSGFDERLEVDETDLRFLFQGVLDKDRAGLPYGQIPWRLGILERP